MRTQREDYDEEHPMSCESCEGWGGTITITDPSMSVASAFGDNSVEVNNCTECIELNKCPRCSSDYNADTDSEDYDESCTFCGFELGKTQGKPYPHHCLCIELEYNNNR